MLLSFKKPEKHNDSEDIDETEKQADDSLPNHAHKLLSLIPLPVFKQFDSESVKNSKNNQEIPFDLPSMFMSHFYDKKSLIEVFPLSEFGDENEIIVVPQKLNVYGLEDENSTIVDEVDSQADEVKNSNLNRSKVSNLTDVDSDKNGFTAVSKFQAEFETTQIPSTVSSELARNSTKNSTDKEGKIRNYSIFLL